MTEGPPNRFIYEHGDVPEGESLQSWKRRQLAPQRKAQVTSGLVAAAATLAPLVLSMRGSRTR